jgi:hypothetical protein
MKPFASLALGLVAATAFAASPEPPDEPLAATTAEPVKDEAPGAADRAFAEALVGCRPAKHEGPHPFVKGFVIEHEIAGESGAVCGYTQTMPGGMTMDCKLSSDGRSALAAEFRELAEGRMSGGTGSQPSWTRECEIVTQDGKRMPMQSG